MKFLKIVVMVYDLAMLKAFYTLYEGKIERIRTYCNVR